MKRRRGQIKMSSGGRNLVILGIISTVVALITTAFSLAIYHNSGDIYLDRSRPGFLPDEEEIENDSKEEEYDFGKINTLDAEAIEEYLTNLNQATKSIDEYADAFDAASLSDEKLGITK